MLDRECTLDRGLWIGCYVIKCLTSPLSLPSVIRFDPRAAHGEPPDFRVPMQSDAGSPTFARMQVPRLEEPGTPIRPAQLLELRLGVLLVAG